MGLKDMSVEDFQKMKETLGFLETFGITEEDLKDLHGMVQAYRNGHLPRKVPEKTKEEKARQELENLAKAKPEDIVKMFADDVEEFYPDGRR